MMSSDWLTWCLVFDNVTEECKMQRRNVLNRRGLRRISAMLAAWVALGLASAPIHASGYEWYIGSIVHVGSTIYLQIANGTWAPNSCGATTLWLTIDPTTPAGQAALAMALSAKATGGGVWANGNAVCAPCGPNGTYTGGFATLYLN